MNTLNAIENLQRQLRISDVLDVLMAQSLQLMEIVNKNQTEVNRLKKELEQLKVHTDNATDEIEDSGFTTELPGVDIGLAKLEILWSHTLTWTKWNTEQPRHLGQ